MADVLLLTATGDAGSALRRLRASAERDPFGVHRLVSDPSRADVILFVVTRDVGPSLRNVRHHTVYRQYRDRCFAYSEYDFVVPLVPGIYPSISRSWNVGGRARGGPYVSWYAQDGAVEEVEYVGRQYLFSFTGAARHAAVRRHLLQLRHPDALIEDTSWWYTTRAHSSEKKAAYKSGYLDTIRRSQFVLCPRGLAASSVRLFDVMCMGRVPVILSDDWLPPEGPDWDAFSIRVPEHEVHRLPGLLEARAIESSTMGHAARLAWETWFHPDVLFHRFVDGCLSISKSRTLSEAVARPITAAQFVLHPPTTKACLWRVLHGKHERLLAA